MIVSLAVQATMILVVGVIGGLFGAWLQELFGGTSTKEFFRLLGPGWLPEKAYTTEKDSGDDFYRAMIDYHAAGGLLIGEASGDEEVVERARMVMREHGYEERFDAAGLPTWAPPPLSSTSALTGRGGNDIGLEDHRRIL